ncbi:DEAD/DEAH box helicase [Rhizobium leguminosarum]|uniref:DEAD/DEAH box helicase n=1 Tax=Rhizobium ruizarguesonis TaxID=2081791 RepID=UPI0013BA6501|nr:DEAD/DEAH box helicase [Rhizobium ruizarguesonis]NEI06157.1 DEAD/DEAH box helicase [Rhizobium ruizarguesonis]
MFDPIGGFDRMIDQFQAYLDTAYRIGDPGVAEMRRALLSKPEQLALDPIFEAVPRYVTWDYGLEALLSDNERILKGFDERQRKAFVELALSGLFDRDGDFDEFVGAYKPYRHQIQMLQKGIGIGTPGIVTSGTGSGKTESFMLPIFAQLAKEATAWPAPNRPYDDDWLDPNKSFQLHRRNEHKDRPKAVRALVLYPLNALVEDQMVRLRKAIDSPDAREVMDRHFNGNRIFFGRYTGKSPVTGFRKHPRLADEPVWKDRAERSRTKLKKEMKRYRAIQRRLADEGRAEDLRFVFPSTDGGELISRWDMQATPPDILVTNQSILNAMLVREVDAPILQQTRDWLMNDADSCFYLVLDELHLIRGSAGAEMAGLLKILLERLGLLQPEHAHKLRILASSASLPMDDENAAASMGYLRNMFGSAGTAGAAPDKVDQLWRDSVVRGDPFVVDEPKERPTAESLVGLADTLSASDYRRGGAGGIFHAFMSAARSIPGSVKLDDKGRLENATSVAAAMLDYAMQEKGTPGGRSPRTASDLQKQLYPESDVRTIRGLLALRAIPDLPKEILPASLRPEREAVGHLPGFRMHCFVRNIEGLFTSLGLDSAGILLWGEPSIERGEDHEESKEGGQKKRLFEMLYCEACGDLYVGGKRGSAVNGGSSSRVSLLPAPQELEKLPESAVSTRFEDAGYRDFALFWPALGEPQREIKDGSPFAWRRSFLNPYTGVVDETGNPGDVPGYLLFWPKSHPKDFHSRGSDEEGTAVPYCCAKCGTDYSGRFRAPNSLKREGRKSPIRSFRTGFAKTSQLLATELVASLKSQGGDGKLVAFSDSREDAANLALDVEVQHLRDLRREILMTEAAKLGKHRGFSEEDQAKIDELEAQLTELTLAKKRKEAMVVTMALDELEARRAAADFPASVPLQDLFEFKRGESGDVVRPILQELLNLGSTPIDGADTKFTRINNKPWYNFFVMEKDKPISWKSEETESDDNLQVLGRARQRVQKEQPPEATDLLFSKTYFALEETGLGWPSFYGAVDYTEECSRNDAWLRIFSDAYRITPNQYKEEAPSPWNSALDMLGKRKNRLKTLLEQIFNDPVAEGDRFLNALRDDLHQTRGDGSIDITRLYFRAARPTDKAIRCNKCGRVHLHAGFNRCTRCGEKLEWDGELTADKVARSNFLGRRVMRAIDKDEPLFRLKCEELTGQTRDPAARLQQFKGVFVREEKESDEDFEGRRRFDTADLLSVTTTMEVGVDIGSLQAVYQGNMPPQRFNYQQRVGRAGRRGQAFSTVLTVCRSKSHDIHYFHNPIEITGAAPPPPFITTGLVDIPSRLLRKFWLVEAFDVLRKESGDDWAGDAMVPGDIHGEFLYCNEYFRDGAGWREKLESALQRTEGRRKVIAKILSEVSKCELPLIEERVTAEIVLRQIDDLEKDFGSQAIGIAAALAEGGLVPLYGMPTRSRNLYVDLVKKTGEREADWDTIDRDQDMAIFDFAPGNVRTREKLRHRCVGFTGVLRVPDEHKDDLNAAQQPYTKSWKKDEFHLRFCDICGKWSKGTEYTERCACGAKLTDTPIHCITPAAYRTDFRPKDEAIGSKVGQLITLASLGEPLNSVEYENLKVNFAENSEIYLVNPGSRTDEDPSGFEGYTVQDVEDGAAKVVYWFKNAPRLKLKGQAIDPTVIEEDAMRWRGGDTVTKAWLASPKVTNSLQIGPRKLNPNLRLLDMDVSMNKRDPSRTSVRAAAVSATELIVQRAALELDIAPEEFDNLAPNILKSVNGSPLPYLQIADALPNGSGFCRHLLASKRAPVTKLIRSILDDPAKWPRKAVSIDKHPEKCWTSCYKCLQRYNNRNFHGLLDWRLGLAYLRAIVDPTYECGFDEKYEAFEIKDWKENAQILADQTTTFIPGNKVSTVDGRSDIPVFTLDGKQSRWGVIVHPLWDQQKLFARHGLDHRFVAIDSFELARRPLNVLQRAATSW